MRAERDREGYRRAIAYVRRHPFAALSVVPRKVFYLFEDDTYALRVATDELRRPLPSALLKALATLSQYYYLAVLALAVVSVALLRGWLHGPGKLLVLVLAYWVVVHAVFFGGARFHFPMVPMYCVLATETLATFWAGARAAHLPVGTERATSAAAP